MGLIRRVIRSRQGLSMERRVCSGIGRFMRLSDNRVYLNYQNL